MPIHRGVIVQCMVTFSLGNAINVSWLYAWLYRPGLNKTRVVSRRQEWVSTCIAREPSCSGVETLSFPMFYFPLSIFLPSLFLSLSLSIFLPSLFLSLSFFLSLSLSISFSTCFCVYCCLCTHVS